MSEPIKVGDLVQVVRPQICGCNHSMGSIFIVDHIEGGPNICSGCGRKFADVLDAWQKGAQWAAGVHSLKRIPPLSELEGQRTEETLREPA